MYSIRQTTRNISDARVRVRVLAHPSVDKQKEKSHENIFYIYVSLGVSMNGPCISSPGAVQFHRVN